MIYRCKLYQIHLEKIIRKKIKNILVYFTFLQTSPLYLEDCYNLGLR